MSLHVTTLSFTERFFITGRVKYHFNRVKTPILVKDPFIKKGPVFDQKV